MIILCFYVYFLAVATCILYLHCVECGCVHAFLVPPTIKYMYIRTFNKIMVNLWSLDEVHVHVHVAIILNLCVNNLLQYVYGVIVDYVTIV